MPVSVILKGALFVEDLAHRLSRVHLWVNLARYGLGIVNVVIFVAIVVVFAQGYVDLLFNQLAIRLASLQNSKHV